MHATRNTFSGIKTYSDSNIEHLGVCTVKLGHKDKVARCRFLAKPGDDPALLGMPYIEMLGILKILGILYKVADGQQVGRKFHSHVTW